MLLQGRVQGRRDSCPPSMELVTSTHGRYQYIRCGRTGMGEMKGFEKRQESKMQAADMSEGLRRGSE